RNVSLFKYARSPTAVQQTVGRGTRLDATSGKLMFRVYDYTDATRLFGQGFVTRPTTVRVSRPGETPPPPSERTLQVEGFDVRVTDAGQYIVTSVGGQARLVTVDEYRARLARRLVEEVPSLEQFRARWIVPPERRELLGRLPDAGRSALLVRALAEMTDFDLYDVLAELGYGLAPRTRPDRAEAFGYKHADWLSALPPATAATLQALTAQFARTGTDGLESPEVFSLPEVVRAGGERRPDRRAPRPPVGPRARVGHPADGTEARRRARDGLCSPPRGPRGDAGDRAARDWKASSVPLPPSGGDGALA